MSVIALSSNKGEYTNPVWDGCLHTRKVDKSIVDTIFVKYREHQNDILPVPMASYCEGDRTPTS